MFITSLAGINVNNKRDLRSVTKRDIQEFLHFVASTPAIVAAGNGAKRQIQRDENSRWQERTGHLSNLVPSLRRALGQYARYCTEFKIGLTVDPQSRWRAHVRDGWREMVVVYSTTSEDYVWDAEQLLIEHGLDAYYYAECLNRIGGGLRRGHRRYYVYIVVA
jgi:hypothetical protein